MNLNELAAGLVKDGILVLCVSDGNITDFLVSEAAPRTLVFREHNHLSSYVLNDKDTLINPDTLPEVLKVSKG